MLLNKATVLLKQWLDCIPDVVVYAWIYHFLHFQDTVDAIGHARKYF